MVDKKKDAGQVAIQQEDIGEEYTTAELAAAATALFGKKRTSAALILAALNMAKVEKTTKEKAIDIVNKFRGMKVK